MRKIKVYVRHSFYSPNTAIANRKRPEWFDKKMVWENFLRVTDSEICEIKVIYDTHFGDNTELFFGDFSNIIKINCGTEASSFLETLEIIRRDDNQDDDVIYFLEDDYLHLPGSGHCGSHQPFGTQGIYHHAGQSLGGHQDYHGIGGPPTDVHHPEIHLGDAGPEAPGGGAGQLVS